ncbi:hypothetical protein [Aureispira anguillae]|uniref:Uncharacterized protein n=1 Tax=Aureispira anguillae TaxID=2864201 RepID=A0A916DSC1_9BACT|nr:hypothetical protein [Aureispira anguillae]BDS10856.1 hypothetical protein AsAng_0015660 [Aureispira anguillae]BDS10912.1 hypothetical protein AsAng_0016220 [Aureispira anguillae]BDS10962.1 hypothetical protein AsAng_0016720 [Aureispira anguillae]
MLLELLLEQQKPQLKKDLEKVIEQLLTSIADSKQLNPFELVLKLSAKKGQAIGQIFTPQKKLLYDFDAGEEISGLFEHQLGRLPEIAKKAVLAKVGHQTISVQVAQSLEHGGAILVRYDKNYQLEYFQQLEKKLKRIDIDHFFANIKI